MSENRVDGFVQGPVVQAASIHGGVHVHHWPAPEPAALPAAGRVPARSALFVGRAGELARLDGLSGRVVVHGLGGVGKSTLVARFAQHNADRFGLVW